MQGCFPDAASVAVNKGFGCNALVGGGGGLVGAVQVYAGLTLVNKVGAGPFVGLTVTAALVTSLVVDHFGWFRIEPHPLKVWRVAGGLLLVGGVSLIAKF